MTGTAPAWFEPEALAFRQRVLESIEGLSPLALAERAERLNREQVTHLSRHCLNLYPGTNIPGMTANFHTNRLSALAVAALESAHIICNMNLNAVLLKVLNYPG